MGKLIIRPKKGVNTINGYDINYPSQLHGIMTLKEWDQTICIINQNMIRNYRSVMIFVAGAGLIFFIGLILVLIIMAIVSLIRWSNFKTKASDDLKKILSSINSQLCVKGITFSATQHEECFTLEISYPDHLTQPIPLETYSASGFNSILLNTYSNSISIVNPNVNFQPYHPKDPRFRSLLIKSKLSKIDYPGWEGFDTASFPFALYNYLTPDEYKAMLGEYNTVLVSQMETSSYKFFVASLILILIGIGILMLIPAVIWLGTSRNKYRKEWNEKINDLNTKYTQLYCGRGLSFDFFSTRKDLPRGFLNIFVPLDCGNGPTFLLLENKKMCIQATVPNMLEPMYINNAPLVLVPIQTLPPPQQQQYQTVLINNTPQSNIEYIDENNNNEKTPLL